MKINYRVLIIDDHPLIAEAYKSALKRINSNEKEYEFIIEEAYDIDSALIKIEKSIQEIKENSQNKNNTDRIYKEIDLIFLDIKLPVSSDGNILSGEELGIKIRECLPNVKIIISTTYNDNYRLHSIMKSVKPEGLMVKNDLQPEDLVFAIKSVINNPPYYSKTVLKLIQKQFSNDLILDQIDRKILYELSVGTKTKDLSNFMPLSYAGIEKRKRHLKEIFKIENADDRELLEVAREKGFI